MPVELVIVEPFPVDERLPGMMWRYPSGDIDGRECWWIVLPGDARIGTPGHPSAVSWRTTDRASKPPHEMWAVSGIPPRLTVSPSIDVLAYKRAPDGTWVRDGSYWHGHITDGVLTP